MTGASSSESFVSCIRSTSGCARSSHSITRSMRALSELTFHVAMRICGRLSVRGRAVAGCGQKLAFTARKPCDACRFTREVGDHFRGNSLAWIKGQIAHLLELQMRALQSASGSRMSVPSAIPRGHGRAPAGPDPCEIDETCGRWAGRSRSAASRAAVARLPLEPRVCSAPRAANAQRWQPCAASKPAMNSPRCRSFVPASVQWSRRQASDPRASFALSRAMSAAHIMLACANRTVAVTTHMVGPQVHRAQRLD